MLHERDEAEDEEREDLLLGYTASLPEGKYNEELARLQHQKCMLDDWEESSMQRKAEMRLEHEKKREERDLKERSAAEVREAEVRRLEMKRKEKEEEERLLAAL